MDPRHWKRSWDEVMGLSHGSKSRDVVMGQSHVPKSWDYIGDFAGAASRVHGVQQVGFLAVFGYFIANKPQPKTRRIIKISITNIKVI